MENLHSFDGDQNHLDSLYDQLIGLMFSGLHKVKRSLSTSRQKHRWFTKDLMNMRKTFHQSERMWLRTKDKEERKCKRMDYVASRRAYAKAVSSSKRKFFRSQQLRLEKLLGNPKRWWRKVKKLGIVKRKVSDAYLDKVLDNNGVIQSGEEAVKVWSAHFREVLQGSKEPLVGKSGRSVCSEAPQGEQGSDNPELEGEITREEVMWALSKAKKRKSTGRDGISLEMMEVEILRDVWVHLFNACWRFGVVPSFWKRSIIVPIPKGRVKGACDTSNFRGISLTSLVGKIMCMVLNNRLADFLEAKELLADEQGGFRRGRGCRDQILSLLLIGQSMVAKKSSGMVAAFIDFRKAYDRVDRMKLWDCLGQYGIGGHFLMFLKGLYDGSMSQVRINNRLGKEFAVSRGLRQGCVLSPLLFSLYINSLVSELKRSDCGVLCGEMLVSSLLFADDTVLLAENAEDMRRSLQCLQTWCEEWSVEINVEKSAMMHMRKKRVDRCAATFKIGMNEIPWVSSYKYLGCVIDEFLDCSEMVEHRVKLGSQALGTWLRNCRESVGEVNGRSFLQLLQSLVESVLMYGVEVWGCHHKLEGLSQIQLRALRIFFGVGLRHPKASLLMEADAMPVAWLARVRCAAFWFRILSNPLYDGRILRVAAVEAMVCGGSWMMKLQDCLKSFGWDGVGAEEVRGLSSAEIKVMLETCAKRSIEDEWTCELSTKPKLATLRLLKEKGSESRCLEVASKSLRRMMMMLRGGTAPLMIESGRWRGLPREERRCRECQSGKIEDVPHWLLECHAWGTERQALLQCMRQVVNDFDNLEEDDKLVCVLDRGCKHASILKAIMKMWSARFY